MISKKNIIYSNNKSYYLFNLGRIVNDISCSIKSSCTPNNVVMINLKEQPKYGIHEKSRLDETIAFILESEKSKRSNPPFLDIGEKNKFSQLLKKELNIEVDNTIGDLNFTNWESTGKSKKYNTVFCFHIIEHLINPLLFLTELRKRCNNDAKIFITYPTGNYWYTCHWHQIDTKRFKLLLKEANLKIIKHRSKILWKDWKYLFFRVRPLLRLLLGQRYQYYELRYNR